MARYRASAIGNVSMTGDTAARRETFEFTGQSSAGVVPLKRGLIILDTNVMSVLESVARKGFRASDVQHRRVEHLLRWLYARPDDQMFTLFGVLEGAGFHEGGVSSYQMFRRAIATSAVVAWARDHIDELVTSEISLPKSAWGTVDVGYNSDRVSLDGGEWAGADDSGLDFASELLPLTVLPCYVASLAAAAAWRGEGSQLEKAQRVHDRLVASLDYVPAFGWLATALLFLGRAPIRNMLETSVFKLRDTNQLRRSCLSAAWDLGYLQLMSVVRAPALRDVFGRRAPILVTDDRQLPWVNSLLACEDNTGIFTVELSHLDPRLAREAVRLLARNQIARVAGAGSWPDWDRCAGAASALERELGIHDAPELRLDPPVRRVTLEMSDIEAYLSALECGTAESALTRVAECDGDAFLGGVVALERLVVDNASVRGRAASDSWGAAIDSLGPKASDLWMVQLAVQLPRAMAEERWPLFNALMGKLSAEGGAGFVFLFLWRLGRIVLEDTAVARSTTIEDLVALLQSKAKSSERDSQPDAGGEPNSRPVE